MAEGQVLECERIAGPKQGEQGGYYQGDHVLDDKMISS